MDVAILDDYQAVAEQMADWSQLPSGINVQFFHDHIADEDQLVERLKNFQVVMGMRERTPFPHSVLERLPELRLLVTAGMGNAVFDIPSATELGIVVSGTGGVGEGPTELTWGLILALVRRIPQEDRLTREGHWGTTVGFGLKEKNLGLAGVGTYRLLGGQSGHRLRHEHHRLEPKSYPGEGGRVWRYSSRQRYLVQGFRLSVGPCPA